MTKPLIALCVGHSRRIAGRIEGGAVSVAGVSEHTYNRALAHSIAGHMARYGDRCVIIEEYEGGSYTRAMQWLASHLKGLNVSAAVELHFNSAQATPTATGHEWLYYHASAESRRLATSVHNEICLGIPQLRSRGVKGMARGNRGWQFLYYTHCPAIIAEPFFGSNPDDWKLATDQQPKIARAIAEGISGWLD